MGSTPLRLKVVRQTQSAALHGFMAGMPVIHAYRSWTA
jgi:hypothetical protein